MSRERCCRLYGHDTAAFFGKIASQVILRKPCFLEGVGLNSSQEVRQNWTMNSRGKR